MTDYWGFSFSEVSFLLQLIYDLKLYNLQLIMEINNNNNNIRQIIIIYNQEKTSKKGHDQKISGKIETPLPPKKISCFEPALLT